MATSRRGNIVVKRKTMKSRFSQKLQAISKWCRENRHLKIRVQHRELCAKLNGHYAYYGITGNAHRIERFREEVKKIWRKWLNRRSKVKSMSWERFNILIHKVFILPPARVVHSIYAARP
jgi:RNA-directed DNA polymerase